MKKTTLFNKFKPKPPSLARVYDRAVKDDDDDDEEDCSDEFSKNANSRGNNAHVLITLEEIENIDKKYGSEKIQVCVRARDRFGKLKGRRVCFSSRKGNENNAKISWGETRDLGSFCDREDEDDVLLCVECTIDGGESGFNKMMMGAIGRSDSTSTSNNVVIGSGVHGLTKFFNNNADDDDETMMIEIPLRIGLTNKNGMKNAKAILNVSRRTITNRRVKRIWLIRHGESAWNEAQRNRDLKNMMAYDHPLTEAGVLQCEKVAKLALNASVAHVNSSDSKESAYGYCTSVWVSPLTRAVQTAMILLNGHYNTSTTSTSRIQTMPTNIGGGNIGNTYDEPPLIDIGGMNISNNNNYNFYNNNNNSKETTENENSKNKTEIRFVRSCREIKSVGGLDSVGVEMGKDAIFRRARDKLKELQSSTVLRDTISKFSDMDENNDYFDVDDRDVRDKWWISADDSDNSTALVDERTKDFWRELKNSSRAQHIVVTHSDFIRKLLRRCKIGVSSSSSSTSSQNILEQVQEKKICNAGCIGLDVEFDRNGDINVLDCELLFGTKFQD